MSTRNYTYKKWYLKTFAQIIDSVGYLSSRPPSSKSLQPKKILVVRLDQLGDILQTRPFFTSLRASYPEAKIYFLTSKIGEQLNSIFKMADHVFAWECAWFDKRRTPNKTARDVARWIRGEQFDSVFELRGDIRLISLLKRAGARNVVGYGATGGGFLLDVDVPWKPTEHAIDKNLSLLTAAGGNIKSHSTFSHPQIVVAENSRLFAVHPDAGTDAKKWSPASFVQVIKALISKGHKIVLVGLDKELGDIIEKDVGDQVENKMGKTSLRELVEILAQSGGLLTNDSGPAHLMSAIGKPVWVIWSGTADPTIWAPRGKEVTIISHSVPCAPCSLANCPIPNHPCLTSISPDEVVNLMCKTLQQ